MCHQPSVKRSRVREQIIQNDQTEKTTENQNKKELQITLPYAGKKGECMFQEFGSTKCEGPYSIQSKALDFLFQP